MRQGILNEASPRTPFADRVGMTECLTNVITKCDTWCELQNLVNHQVFERKLRPKPFGREHVCLGVTHRVTPHLRSAKGQGAEIGLPFAFGVLMAQMLSLGDSRHYNWWSNTQSLASSCRCVSGEASYIVPPTRGCSPFRPDAVMSTTGNGRHSVLRIFKGHRGRTRHHATCGALPVAGPYLRLSHFPGGQAVKQKT
ncbi:hypothetical protein SASPL_144243 [Salvia splendens]|uniref:Uncharacterized protein n=1 Tax=Salvia splendens TaxID=180675 RepID=A0A8X8ZA78_SALSN|nr:hypothetical protein SASPL_144243 [Salvia splendens]